MENLTEFNRDQYIRDRYQNAISYYWKASRANKKWYKITRSLTIIFGAGVTLIASLTSSEIIVQNKIIEMIFKLGTPLLAAMLTVIAGFSQGFQWGSTWQNMIITAQELEREFDKFLVTPEDQRDYLSEAEKLNSFVITESKGFFERMLGTGSAERSTSETTIT
jgi:hypothetical protein